MKHLTKILALVIIATFLASIPIVLADNKPQLAKAVFELKLDTNDAKPSGGGGGSPGGSKGPAGYSLMGVSWKLLPITIQVDSASAQQNAVFFSAVSTAVLAWDAQTSKSLASTVQLSDVTLSVDINTPDGVNEVMFGAISSTNVIAQTTVWYNPSTREIVDFDMVFNTYFTWGDATQNPTVMDIQNIATHELGHSFGLADLYQLKYSAQTMYGYASQGQTNKRTLESGDIAGIQALYGQ